MTNIYDISQYMSFEIENLKFVRGIRYLSCNQHGCLDSGKFSGFMFYALFE